MSALPQSRDIHQLIIKYFFFYAYYYTSPGRMYGLKSWEILCISSPLYHVQLV